MQLKRLLFLQLDTAEQRDALSKNGLLHRIIWTMDQPIDNHLVIDHLDGKKDNNTITNLQAVTLKESFRVMNDIT